jgi:hypothetical protein
VRCLAIILDDVKLLLPRRKLGDAQRKRLVDIFATCFDLLQQLNRKLEKYADVERSLDPDNPYRAKLRTAWARLSWKPKDVDDYRQRVATNVALLNAFYNQMNRYSLSHLPCIRSAG